MDHQITDNVATSLVEDQMSLNAICLTLPVIGLKATAPLCIHGQQCQSASWLHKHVCVMTGAGTVDSR